MSQQPNNHSQYKSSHDEDTDDEEMENWESDDSPPVDASATSNTSLELENFDGSGNKERFENFVNNDKRPDILMGLKKK